VPEHRLERRRQMDNPDFDLRMRSRPNAKNLVGESLAGSHRYFNQPLFAASAQRTTAGKRVPRSYETSLAGGAYRACGLRIGEVKHTIHDAIIAARDLMA
jgi:hypothetical protein